MKTLILFIALYLVISCTVYGQEIPNIVSPDLFAGKDLYKNDRLNKKPLMESKVESLTDFTIDFITSTLLTQFKAIKVRDNYAYCVFANGLVILDISDKSKPVIVSQLYLGVDSESENDIFLDGNYAYIANGANGLKIINVSNPASPVLVGGAPGGAYRVTVSGSYAYVVDGGYVLRIINVSNPESLSVKGTYSNWLLEYFKGVASSGSYAYVANGWKGLQIINVSNPASPVLARSYDIHGDAMGIIVSGSYAYVADREGGLQIINVSNPASPVLAGSYDTPGYALEVMVSGNYAYVADGEGGLQIINVSSPSSPFLAGSYKTTGNANRVTVSGNYVYGIDGNGGFQSINVSNPALPFLAGSYGTFGESNGVTFNGSYAYVAVGSKGIQIINMNNPVSPVIVGSYDTPGNACGIMVSGNYAYVADYDKGLQIINVSNPASPVLAGSYDTQGYSYGVFVNENYVYVADGSSGVQIINVGNPASPVLAGNYDTPGDAKGVYVSGNYAYISDGSNGLQIINVSNPASPVLAGNYDTRGDAKAVYVSGNHAYISDGSSGLQIINVSNPSSPVLVSSYDTPGDAKGIYVSGNYAYVVDGNNGVQIINVSNPSSPIITAAHNTPGDAKGVMVSGNYTYVADSYSLIILKYGTLNTPPSASFTITPTSGTTSTIFQFDASNLTDAQDSVSALQVRWDWENDGTWDSNYSTTKTATHQYNSVGTYIVKLEVKDTGGLTAATTKPCTVRTEGVTIGHFRVAYTNTGNNSTLAIQTPPQTTITINNNIFALSTSDEIAIYSPLPDSICCGVGIWNGSNMAITIWGDNDQTATIKEGLAPGQAYTFHLWDASELKEYRFLEATFSTGPSTYSANALSIVSTLVWPGWAELPIPLPSGWNMISSNVIPQLPRMDSVFQNIVSKVEIVKNGSGKVYWPRFGINQIGGWNVVEGYQVYIKASDTLKVRGQRVNPSTPISLSVGWSMIAYLPTVPTRTTTACSTISDKVVILKDGSGKVWWPRFGIDQIGTMQVGKGYQIYLSSAGTLIYPASAAKEGNNLVDGRNRGQLSPQHFAYVRATGANATILLKMNEKPVINGVAVEIGDEIGVFTPEGICAGAGVWNGDDIVITVWGDNGETASIDGFTDGQAYTFKIWDKSVAVEKDISVVAQSGNLTYSENGITVISYEKSTALPDNFVLRQNYPNPFNPTTRIEYQIKEQSEVTLSIFNTAGQLILILVQSSQPAGIYSVEWDGRNSSGIQVPSGIYLYRLKAGNIVEARKMVMIK